MSSRLKTAIVGLSEPAVVQKVLSHLDLPTTLLHPAAARAPPWEDIDLDLDLDAVLAEDQVVAQDLDDDKGLEDEDATQC